MKLRTVLATALAAAPSAAWACGGLFCNNSQPVNQSAERILFAVDDEHVDMHVRISYAGPPADFGWLLPTPRGVETTLSSEQLFTLLDQRFGPVFQLNRDFGDNCAVPDFAAAGGDGENGPPRDGGVQVLSREAVGPFDRAILEAESVADLRAWLDENEYQVPEGVDPKLQPYIDAGAVFVAVKLLPGSDAGDIQPLRLRFPGDVPAVPIVPTSVAADPDMGIIVHVVGEARAIPANYRHVQINESAIDWLGGGQNYADVVSKAVDEAGGKAFTTDSAGPHGNLEAALAPVPAGALALIRNAQIARGVLNAFEEESFGFRADADIIRVMDASLEFPDELNAATWMQCPECYDRAIGEQAIDGAAIAARIEDEVNAPREPLVSLLTRMPYLTRLYSTMSADEMDQDPTFDFNADLPEVNRTRTATLYLTCDDDNGEVVGQVLAADSGGSVRIAEDGTNPRVIRRERGQTVRGQDVTAARIVEQLFTAGQPEVEIDNRDDIDDAGPGGGPGAGPGGAGGASEDGDDDDDSGCQAAGGSTLAPFALLLLAGVRRRRR